jgi:hypothetical protein
VTALWLLGAVLAGTVLLAALAVGGSRWTALQRAAAPSLEDLLYAAGQRYRLGAAELEAVRRTVRKGEAAPAGLQAAVFDVATGLQAVLSPRIRSRKRAWLTVVGSALLVAGWLLLQLVRHRYFGGLVVPVEVIVIGGGFGLYLRRRRHHAQRAALLNRPVEDRSQTGRDTP